MKAARRLASPRGQHLRRWRAVVVAASLVGAVVGSIVLATRHVGEDATTTGITATLRVPSHPGWISADTDALWVALNGDPRAPAAEQALVRVDVATGAVQQTVLAGGQATFVTRVGNRLIASVQHAGDDAFQARRLLVLDWTTGRVVLRRGFGGPVDHMVSTGKDLWALQVRPGALLHLDPVTLAPVAAPLPLSNGRMLDIAAGAGYLWATAVDDGEVLRIDPLTGTIAHVPVGGSPTGIVVAGDSVWVTDPGHGRIIRRHAATLRPVGDPIDVGGRPTWLAATPRFVFAVNASDGTVTRIDVRSGKKVGPRIRIATSVQSAAGFAIAQAGPVVWVSGSDSNTLTRISAAIASSRPPTTTAFGGGTASVATPPSRPAGDIVARIPVPGGPGGFAVGEGGVWSGDAAGGTLTRIDPGTNAVVATIPVPRGSGTAAAGEGAIWLTSTVGDRVSRVDPRTNKVVATIPVGPQPDGVAVGAGAVWVVNIGGPSISRIDPKTNRVVATVPLGPKKACCSEHMPVTVGDNGVWAGVPNMDALVRIDPNDNSIAETVNLDDPPCAGLVADAVEVWFASGACADVLTRIDAGANRRAPTTVGEPHPIGLALLSGSLWVAVLGSRMVDRIDPVTGRIVGSLRVGGIPIRLDDGYGSVWLRDDAGSVVRIRPAG